MVSSQKNDSLKLNGGRFSSQNFEPGTSNRMNDALNKYFTEDLPDGYEVYNLGTLDTKDITLLESLTPSNFLFRVLHTNSNRDILQLFIALLESYKVLQPSILVSLSQPVLLSSSQRFFNILPGLVLEGVEPANNQN